MGDEAKTETREWESKIPEIRSAFQEKHKESIDGGLYDARDVERFEKEDGFTYCFLDSGKVKGDVEKGVELLDTVFKYRKEIKLNDLTEESFPEALRDEKFIYYNGKDKKGQKIMYMKVANHKKGTFVQETKNMVAWFCEKHHKENAGGDSIVIIFDFTGAGVTNMDLDITKHLLSCLSTYFPGILDKIYLFEMPFLLNAIWRIIQAWLTEDQKKTILFVKKATILEFVAADELEPHMVK